MRNVLTLSLLILLVLPAAASATIHHVDIGDNFFAPSGTTVAYGDTVRWTWVGSFPHTTTSDAGSPKTWDSGILPNGSTFDVVIVSSDGTGPFPYHCAVHSITMKDTIWVDNDDDGYTADIDCDDNDPDTNPGGTEVCDGVDNDCNTVIDDNAVDASTWWIDNDNDGYGATGGATTQACDQPNGYVDNDLDCNDANPNINPGADEIPDDQVDQNCDGLDQVTCYEDLDGDNYGHPTNSGLFDGACGVGYVSDNSDCDDGDPDTHPGAFDIPNDGIDQDCDGMDATGGTCCLLRADINHDSAGPDIADLVYLVNYMFNGGPAPVCEEPAGQFPEADVNGDGAGPDIADLVYLVNYMFNGGPPPMPCP